MSVAELREHEEVNGLITRGQRVGVLTYAEIATATSEVGLDEADIEELHGLIERCEIELVEEIDPATAASVNIERAPEMRGRRKPHPGSTAGDLAKGLNLNRGTVSTRLTQLAKAGEIKKASHGYSAK